MVSLISYPRSGQTWLRYCTEYLSKRPVYGFVKHNRVMIDDEKFYKSKHYILRTTHNFRTIEEENKDSKLILIIRNYKECIRRQNSKAKLRISPNYEDYTIKSKPHFFYNIEGFERWTNPKLFIYYEDLLTDPKETFKKYLDFLEIDYTYLPEFLKNYNEHKRKSVLVYSNLKQRRSDDKENLNIKELKMGTNSYTQGEHLLFYSLNKEQENLRWERIVKENYPTLYEKYLKVYDEKNYKWKDKKIYH